MCRALTSLVVTGLVSGGQCRSRSGAQQASRRKLVSRSVRELWGNRLIEFLMIMGGTPK